jgi:hypothetical protein
MGGDKLLPEVTGLSIDSPEGSAIAENRKETFRREFLPHLRPTRDLLEHYDLSPFTRPLPVRAA